MTIQFFLLFLFILFVSPLSLVYKQLLSSQNAVHKLFSKKRKAKARSPYLLLPICFLLQSWCWQMNFGRQAAPSPPLPAHWMLAAPAGCRGALLMCVSQESGPHSPTAMPALLVSKASGCVSVLRSQPEAVLFRLIHFITFMTAKIYSLSAPVLKAGVRDLWITRNISQREGHSACFAMQEISLDITNF